MRQVYDAQANSLRTIAIPVKLCVFPKFISASNATKQATRSAGRTTFRVYRDFLPMGQLTLLRDRNI